MKIQFHDDDYGKYMKTELPATPLPPQKKSFKTNHNKLADNNQNCTQF